MARTNSNFGQPLEDDFRKRFLDSLDVQETLERDAGRRVASLAALLARAGRAIEVDGDGKLAQRLEALCQRLRDRPLDPALSREVAALGSGLLEFMDARDRSRGAQLAELERCAVQLEGLLTSWRARGAVKRFRKRIPSIQSVEPFFMADSRACRTACRRCHRKGRDMWCSDRAGRSRCRRSPR